MQLSMFKKLPDTVLQAEWMKDHVKNPPPVNVTDDQRRQAQEKLMQIKQLKINKYNLS